MVRNVAREVHMNANVGDRIVVESEAVGTPTREGEILEVVEGEVGDRFRVRWADGHETVFTPSGGSARIVPREPVAT
jgi:hypothetical protein